MKKRIITVALAILALAAASTSHASCNKWGKVNYVYKANNGVMAFIGGTACWVPVTGTNATAIAAVLATAHANNKQGYLASNGEVAIEYQ